MKLLFRRLFGQFASDQSGESVDSESSAPDPLRSPEIENLEPRMLFSAAPVEPDANAETEGQDQAAEESVVVSPAAAQAAAAEVTETESTQEGLVAGSTLSGQSSVPVDQEVNLVDLNPGVEEVHRETLEAVAEAAAERWRATGLTDEQSAALDQIEYQIADLRGTMIGQTEGTRITLDINAASSLWFIDPTPFQDEEFVTAGLEGSSLLVGIDGSIVNGRYDLLSAIMHEQGHVLGVSPISENGGDVMNEFLSQESRRLPQAAQAEGAQVNVHVAGDDDDDNFHTFALNAAGKVESTGGSQSFDNRQPYGTANYAIATVGTFPFQSLSADDPDPNALSAGSGPVMGSIMQFGGNFAPAGWSLANGQILSISSNSALFSILGTTYGGDGETTFGLPDLRGRVPVGIGTGAGLAEDVGLGEKIGGDTATLNANNLPSHDHNLAGGGSTENTGAAAAFNNRMPGLGLTPVIALQGTFPSPNAMTSIGAVYWFAGNFAPESYAVADGQLVNISSNTALFSILGTTYGGDGETTFGLPDLRGRTPIHAGDSTAPGLSPIQLGQKGGTETVTLTENNLPGHTHQIENGSPTLETGGGQSINLRDPFLALNYQISLGGIFPSPNLRVEEPPDGGEDPEATEFRSGNELIGLDAANELVQRLASEGISRWIEAGISVEQAAQLQAATYEISNLDTGYLASVTGHDVVTIDADASNAGWFVDLTPGEDGEFGATDSQTGELLATDDAARPHYDLLTTIMHEQGHLLGISHALERGSVMSGMLGIGGRLNPEAGDIVVSASPDPSTPFLAGAGSDFIAQIGMFAGNFQVSGYNYTNGQLLPIAQNSALFSLLGTTYGGDGETNFALPDFRGRAVVHSGDGSQGPGLRPYSLGEKGGLETRTLTEAQMASHDHAVTNTAPAENVNTGLTVDEGDTGTVIDGTALEFTDAEQVAATAITYTLDTVTANGTLHLSGGAALTVGATFTQDDINNNLLTYTHTAGDGNPDSFQFDVKDSVGTSVDDVTFAITVTSPNTAPTQSTNTGLTVDEGDTGTVIDETALAFTDAEQAAAAITYTIDTAPTRGTLKLSGGALAAGGTFTQDDLDNDRVTYDHTAGDDTDDTFRVDVSDGAGGAVADVDFAITVDAVVTTPTVSVSGGVVTLDDTAGVNNNVIITLVTGPPDKLRITDVGGLTASGGGAVQVDINTIEIPLAGLTTFNINAGGGDDNVTLDITGGNPLAGLTTNYDGGAGGHDILTLIGPNAPTGTISSTFRTPNDGTVFLRGFADVTDLNYSNLEPIINMITVGDLELDFTGGAETIRVFDDTASDGMETFDSTLGELLDTAIPSDSVTINAGTGDDIIRLESLDAGWDADLIINGDDATDTVEVTGNLDLDSGDLTVTTENIDLGANTVTTTGNQILNGTVSAEGVATLEAVTATLGGGLSLEIGGTTPGTGAAYDQLAVNGAVDVTGATLTIAARGGYVPTGGESFTLVNNDGSGDAVTGLFAGLAEGATLSDFLGSGIDFTLTYTGGDGNDVVAFHDAAGIIRRIGTPQWTAGNDADTISGFTAAAGDNRLLVVFAYEEFGDTINLDTDSPPGVTFGSGAGNGLTFLGGHDGSFNERIEVWYKVLGSGGAITGDVVMNDIASGTGTHASAVAAVVYEGVDQGNAVDAASFVSIEDLSNVVASEFGDLVIGAAVNFFFDHAAGTGQSEIHHTPNMTMIGTFAGGAYPQWLVSSEEGGSPSVDLSTTGGGGFSLGFNINAAAPEVDFGDAAASYGAAGHSAIGATLGTLRDAEANAAAVQSANADGDDTGGSADEDGLVSVDGLTPGDTGKTVTVSVDGATGGEKIDAWIDFNGDGSFDATTERITAAGGQAAVNGNNVITFDVPAGAVLGDTVARFRLSTAGAGLDPTGGASDGEVEDHAVTIGASDTTTITIDGTGNLVITDTDGTIDNEFELSSDGTTLTIVDNSGVANTLGLGAVPGGGDGSDTVTVAFGATDGSNTWTGGIIVNGAGGDDSLEIDFTNPDFDNRNFTFNGGANGAGRDELIIDNGSFTAVTHDMTAGDSGNFDIDGNIDLITYTGLEPVDMTGSTATDFVLNLPAGVDAARLINIGGNNVRLESTDAVPTFESTDFVIPTGSVTINGSAVDGDTLTLGSNLDFGGANFTVTGARTVAGGNFALTADTIDLADLDLGGNTLTVMVTTESTLDGVVTSVGGGLTVAGGAVNITNTSNSLDAATDLQVEAGSELKIRAGASGSAEFVLNGGELSLEADPSAVLPDLGGLLADPDLALWLDARDPLGTGTAPSDGDVVTAWIDKSGNGRDADTLVGDPRFVVASTASGAPALAFTNDMLYTTYDFNNLGADYTILTVSRYTGGDNERVVGSVGENFLLGHHGGQVGRFYANGWVDFGTTGDNVFHQFSVINGPSADGVPGGGVLTDWYMDGVQRQNDHTGVNDGDYKPGRLAVGGGNGGTGERSNSEVSQLVVFNRALSDADRLLVEQWLAQETGGGVASDFSNNDVTVLANSTLHTGTDLGETDLASLTIATGVTLTVTADLSGSEVRFTDTTLNGGTATLNANDRAKVNVGTTGQTADTDVVIGGNGTVTLPDANTYVGTTTVTGTAALVVGNATSLGGGGTTVSAGAALVLEATNVAESITINGAGNATYSAALFDNATGTIDFNGTINVASSAKIQSQAGGEFDLNGAITIAASQTLTLDADNRMDVDTTITGDATTALRVTGGGDYVDLHQSNPNFAGTITVQSQGRLDAHVAQAFGTGDVHVTGSDASVFIRNGHTHANNFFIEGDGRGTEGALRSEGSNNTITGLVTLTGNADIYVNNSTLTLTQGLAGSFTLSKTGANTTSRLILQQDSANLAGFNLNHGQVRLLTARGLGNSTTIDIEADEAIEFDFGAIGSVVTYSNSATDLNTINVNDGTIDVVNGEVTLDANFTINQAPLGNVNLGGDGTLNIETSFGNGNAGITNALDHYGFHINNDNLALNLDANGGMMGGGDPTTFSNFFGSSLLTDGPGSRGLDFNDDNDFINTGSIGTANNYSNLWVGYFTPDASGTWTFRNAGDDDRAGIWFDTDQSGVFDSSAAGLGDNRGEQLSWENTGAKTVTLTAGQSYLVAFTHREGGGGSRADFRVNYTGAGTSTITGEEIVKPTDSDQAGMWSPFLINTPVNNVTKFGSGTTTLAAANTYNGETTVAAGTLVVSSNDALGLDSSGTTVNPGASLLFDGGIAYTTAEAITVAGNSGGGTVGNLSGSNSFDGTIVIGNAGTAILNSIAGDLTINGVVSGTGAGSSITKNGAGSLTLSGNNTFEGGAAINGGSLIAASNTALGSAAAGTTVAEGAILGLSGGITITGEAISLNGNGAGSGALLNISGNNAIAATSSLVAEVVSLGQMGIGSLADTLTIESSVDLQLSKLNTFGDGDIVINGVISGSNTQIVDPTQRDVILGNAIAGEPGFNALAYWEFNNGTAVDSTGNGNAGVVGSGVVFSNDTGTGNGQAIEFDAEGSNDRITVASAGLETIDDQLTIGFWIKADHSANPNWFRVMRKGNESSAETSWIINRESNTSDLMIRYDTAATGGTHNQNRNTNDVSGELDGTWRHVVFVADNGTSKEYVDGTLVSTQTFNPGTTLGNTFDLVLGNISGNWSGLLDEVFILDTAANDSQVSGLWDARNGQGVFVADNSLVKQGSGTLTLNATNTYEGATSVEAGTLSIDGEIGNGAGADTVTIASGATLSGGGTVNAEISATSTLANIVATGDLVLGLASSSSGISFQGTLNVGTHQVTLNDSGSVLLGKDTILAGGTLIAANGVSLGGGEAISGAGTVQADVATNSGSLNPGGTGATGALIVDGDLDFGAGSAGAFPVEFDASAGDSVAVTGAVNLTNVDLNVATLAGYAPTDGSQVTLIDSQGAGAISGMFNGLADGAEITALASGDIKAYLSYFGGDGNDVTISFIDTVNPGTVTVDDTGADGDTIFELRIVGDTLQVLQNGAVADSRPISAVRALEINGDDSTPGGEGDDVLTIDYSLDPRLVNIDITFNGLGQATATGDRLVVSGGAFGVVTHNLVNGTDGNIHFDGDGVADITYTGLEPVDMTGSTATDFIFNLPAGADNAQLSDQGAFLRLKSTDGSPTFEQTDFIVPTGSITINGGAGDTLTVSTALTIASDLAIDVPSISLTGNISTTAGTAGGDQTYDGTVTLGATVGLTADDVFLNNAVSLGANNLAVNVSGISGSSGGGISGTGQLIKQGTGTFTLTGSGAGNNSYTGLTQVQGGVLVLGAGFGGDSGIRGNITVENTATMRLDTGNGIINSSIIAVNAGGTFDFNNQAEAVGYFSGAGSIDLGSATVTLDLPTAGNGSNFSGDISGTGGLTLRGALGGTTNRQILSGDNSYSGATTIDKGILRAAHNNALGSTAGGTTVAGANTKLEVDGGITTAEAITIGAGQTGGGAITSVSGTNTFTGAISLASGADFRGSNMTFQGGITSLANQGLSFNGSNYIVNTNPIDLNGGTLTITSAGNNPANAAQLNVGGNDWGLMRINFGGYITLGAANVLPSDSNVEFGWHVQGSSSGTLDLNGFDQTVASIGVTPFFADMAGDQNNTGGGTLTVNQTANTEYQGRITDGATATSLVKDGAGTLTLNNLSGTATSYTGDTIVNDGTLVLIGPNSATGAIGSSTNIVVNNGGTITTGTSIHAGGASTADNGMFGSNSSASRTITINAGGLIANANGTTQHLSHLVLDGGTLNATTANPTWGNWNVDHGVSTSGTGTTSSISGGNVKLTQAGGTNFDIAATDTLNVSSVIADVTSGGETDLVKTGGGTMVLTGTNTYLNLTSVNAGTLLIDGDSSAATGAVSVANGATLGGTGTTGGTVTVASGGTLSPGASPGILSTGDLDLDGDFAVEVDGGAGSGMTNGHDQASVTGTVDLDAGTSTVTFDFTDLGAGDLSAGDELVIIANDLADPVTGRFSNFAEGALVASNFDGNLDMIITYQGGDGNDVALLVGRVTTEVKIVGDDLIIEDIDGADTNDQLTVKRVGANLVISDADDAVFIDATTVAGSTGSFSNSVEVSLAGFSGNVILRTLGGDDTMVFENLDLTGIQGLTVEDGTGTDSVTFQTADSDLNNGNVNVTADSIVVNAAIDAGTGGSVTLNGNGTDVTISADVTVAGSSTIDVDATRSITVNNGATVTADSGSIEFDANTGGTTTGSFHGILLDSGNVETTSGAITLNGEAGDTNSFHGVYLVNDGDVFSGGTGAGVGDVTVRGTGSVSAFGGNGVRLDGGGSVIQSRDGNVSVIGRSKATSAGQGVYLTGGADIRSTGTGANAANILVDGRGSGSSATGATGVDLHDSNARIQSVDGDISVTETAGSFSGNGIAINNGADIYATGDGEIELTAVGTQLSDLGLQPNATIGDPAATGTITINADSIGQPIGSVARIRGTGDLVIQPRTVSRNIFIATVGPGLRISTDLLNSIEDGFNSVTIGRSDGTGTVTVNSSTFLDDVTIYGGDINVNGTLSNQVNESIALQANDDVTISANVTTTGSGWVDVDAARSITVNSGATVSTVNGGIDMDANAAGTATGDFHGIEVNNAVVRSTGTGNVTLAGQGGTTGPAPKGVFVRGGATISGGNSGTLSVTGIGGTGTGGNTDSSGARRVDGVQVNGAGSIITSSGADVEVNGSGGTGTAAISRDNNGVDVLLGADITAGGTGTVTVEGTGGAGGSVTSTGHHGVLVEGAGSFITSNNGAVNVTGSGGGRGNAVISNGVTAFSGGVFSAGGAASPLTISGTGGTGSGGFHSGFWAGGGQATSGGGSIQITGTGGSGGSDNTGIELFLGSGSITTATNGGDITLISDNMKLDGGTISGPDSLTIRTLTSSESIGIGGGTGTLNLNDTELGNIADGFNSITIGDTTNGTGAVDVDSSTFLDNITIVGGTVSVTELNAGANDTTLTARTGAITDGGDGGTDVTGANVTLNAEVAPAGTSSVATNSSGGAFPVSNSDLLEGITGTVSGTSLQGREGTSSNPSILTNGQFGTGGAPLDLAQTVSINNNTTITWQLNTAASPDGYDITNINTYSGWRDAGRDNQNFTARYATVDNPGVYINITGVSFVPNPVNSGESLISADGSGIIARRVGEIQLFFGAQENTYVGYREIDVIGTPSVGSGDAIGASGDAISLQADTITTDTSATNGNQFLSETDTITINGFNAGNGTVEIDVSGEFDLTADAVANGTFVEVEDGATFDVNGAINTTAFAGLTINDGGTLQGDGDLAGTPVTVNDGGTVSPGVGPKVIGTGSLTLNVGGVFFVEIDGLDGAGMVNGHDQLNVTGTVNLDGATLSIDQIPGGYTPTAGETFVIINNDGGDAVMTGTFAGLPEGSIISTNNGGGLPDHLFTITYQGGTNNNDVVLEATGLVATTNVYIDSGGNLVIDDILAGGTDDNIRVTLAGGSYVIEELDGNALGTLIVGAIQTAVDRIEVPVGLLGVNGGIDINTLSGADTVTIGDLGTLNANGNLDVDGGAGEDRINQTGDVTLSGTGAVDYTAEGIEMRSGSSLTTASGDVTMTGTGGTGNLNGVALKGAEIISASGEVTLTGQGGDSGFFNRGVLIDIDISTGMASEISTGGEITISGTGGTGAFFENGVEILGSTVESTGAGPVSITGIGGTGSMFNAGVTIQKGSTVDAGTGDLTVSGTGGSTGSFNLGLAASNSDFKSAGGNIALNGQGGGTGTLGIGIELGAVDISTNGTGTVTLRGAGANGGSNNVGTKLAAGSTIGTVDGAILIEGTGNGNGTGLMNHGVELSANTAIGATGMGSITVNGTSGDGSILNTGVDINSGSSLSVAEGHLTVTGTGTSDGMSEGVNIGNSTLSSSGAGNISVTGTGSVTATGASNIGVDVSASILSATGTGAITLIGQGGTGSALNTGVSITVGSNVSTSSGVIIITGSGGGTGMLSNGVTIGALSSVSAGAAGTVTITGTSANGTMLNSGVAIESGSSVSVVDGDLTIDGTGRGNSIFNEGVKLSGAMLNATGQGDITVRGTGSQTAPNGMLNHGVSMTGGGINTADGDITLHGSGGTGSLFNDGIHIVFGTIRSTNGGTLSLTGESSAATTGFLNTGAYLLLVTLDSTGPISVTGTGGGGTLWNHGIHMSAITAPESTPATDGTAGTGDGSKEEDGDFF